jgi:hypothetical protein
LECLAIPGQGSLETLDIGELGIRKTLGPVLFAVLNDAYVHDVAVGEELGNGLDGGIVGQVAKMSGERRLLRQLLWKVVAEGVVALRRQVLILRFEHNHGGTTYPYHCWRRTRSWAYDDRKGGAAGCLAAVSPLFPR